MNGLLNDLLIVLVNSESKQFDMRIFLTALLIFSFCSCKKSIGVDTSNSPEISSNSQVLVNDTFYFKAKFNGTFLNWIVPSKNNLSSYQFHSGASFGYDSLGSQSADYCYYLVAFTQIFSNDSTVRPQINIGFNMASQRSDRDEFLSWFSPGFKNYGKSRSSTAADKVNPAKNGVIVYYIDQNGKSWVSNDGLQQGSFFESVSVTDFSGYSNYTYKIWKARFSCKLYDNAGNSINVENGEIYNQIMVP
jgi:hypothetical protein